MKRTRLSSASLFLGATLSLAAAMEGGFGLPAIRDRDPKKPKYPFTEEELTKLAGLSGKEKKLYVKELRSRYDLQTQKDDDQVSNTPQNRDNAGGG